MDLADIAIFSALPREQLEALVASASTVTVAANDVLFSEGDTGDAAYIVEKGEVEVLRFSDGRQLSLAVEGPGALIGEMALLESGPRTATIRATEDTTLLAIARDDFLALLDEPGLARRMLATVLQRMRQNQIRLRSSERLAQLGTLTAGVAHELNNPAAAIERAAQRLAGALERVAETSTTVAHVAPEVRERLAALRGKPSFELTAVGKSDLAEDIAAWLDAHHVPDPWTLAPDLVEAGLGREQLDEVAAVLESSELAAAIAWVAANSEAQALTSEIAGTAQRMTAIVSALKSYTYLDRGPLQEVDIHEGIDSTLLLLRSKLQPIRVVRDYDPDLPRLMAHGAELNQVWTNLIDNAADALDDRPTPEITIRTRPEGGEVVVEVADNGPGIPGDIIEQVFDPFFTTKPPGSGTGLGLDISYDIVARKHHGDLSVRSDDAGTVFTVRLPIAGD